MDYSHTTSSGIKAQPIFSPKEDDFFTAGVGNVPEDLNPDLETSLNTDFGVPEARPSVGDLVTPPEALSFAKPELSDLAKAMEQGPSFAHASPDFIPVSEVAARVPQADHLTSLDRSAIKTDKKLSKTGLREVHKVEKLLDQTDDISNFYSTVRSIAKTHLDNSYNVNSAWKDAA